MYRYKTQFSTRLSIFELEGMVNPAPIGGLDPTFGDAGKLFPTLPGLNNQLSAVAVQTDGKIVAVGSTGGAADPDESDILITRFLPNGTLDTSFGTGGRQVFDLGDLDFASSVVILPDGRIFAVGTTASLSGPDPTVRVAVAAVDSSGTPSTTTFPGGATSMNFGPSPDQIDFGLSATLDGAGKIVIVGGSLQPSRDSGTDSRFLDFGYLRLNSNGSVDTAGRIDFGDLEFATSAAVAPNGTVFIGGTYLGFQDLSGDFLDNPEVIDFAVATLTPAGGTSALPPVDLGGVDIGLGIAVDIFGRPVIAGVSGTATNIADAGVVRLTPAGAPDSTFGPGGVRVVDLGSPIEFAARVLTDDHARIILVGATSTSTITAQQIRDAIETSDFSVLAGFITQLNTVDFLVARLRPDGTLDPAFSSDGKVTIDFGGLDAGIGAALDANGRIIVTGITSDAEFNFRPVLARLIGESGLSAALLAGGPTDGSGSSFGPTPLFDSYELPGTEQNLIPGFTGNVRVTLADVNGDRVLDRIAGAGPGDQRVIVYDGKTGDVLADFRPFESSFTLGVYVSAADITGDGRAEVVITPDQGGGARVIVYDGGSLTDGTNSPTILANFIGLADLQGVADEGFRGGARAALGDVNGDGVPDLVVSAGFLGGPRITIWDGKSVAAANGGEPDTNPIANFFAFEESLRNGAFVSVGDVNGDGYADLIFGGGPSGGPRVRIADGKLVSELGSDFTLDDPALAKFTLVNFFAGDEETRGGIRVAARDLDGDQFADLVTGSGDKLRSEIRVYTGSAMMAEPGAPSVDQVFDPFGLELDNGVFVG